MSSLTNNELDAPPWLRVESTLMSTARLIREAFDTRLKPLDLNLTQASLIAYGPARRSANALIRPEVRAELPTAEERRADALIVDHAWWAANRDRLQARFEAWLRGAGRFVYDFSPEDRN